MSGLQYVDMSILRPCTLTFSVSYIDVHKLFYFCTYIYITLCVVFVALLI